MFCAPVDCPGSMSDAVCHNLTGTSMEIERVGIPGGNAHGVSFAVCGECSVSGIVCNDDHTESGK